jgi:hypothetical protein
LTWDFFYDIEITDRSDIKINSGGTACMRVHAQEGFSPKKE